MPSKAILASANRLYHVQHAGEFGIHVGNPTPDLPAIIARKRRLINEFADYRIEQLNSPELTLVDGKAAFLSAESVQVSDRVLSAPKFIVATGSDTFVPKVPGLEEAGYLTSDEALELEECPESICVLGGGPIGLELGQFYSRIGARVTLLQRSSCVLSNEDPAVGNALGEYLREDGMDVRCSTRVNAVEQRNGKKVLHIAQDDVEATIEVDQILVATGRSPALEGLNLAAAGVEHTARGIATDTAMRTSNSSIFAVGDVTVSYDIVHVAIQQGEIAAHNALASGPPQYMDYRVVPIVIFTEPQYGRVGMTEKEAGAKGLPIITASYPFNDHGKALCLGETRGFVKMVGHAQTGEILGYQVLGPEGGELIHECIVALHYRTTAQDFMRIPHYHPTLAEILTYPAEEIAEQVAAQS
jgi:pyruvate/2-oxoglutarate dehydrogenase complex dihydrolipoamide dehydrogenase (E3) component